MTKKQITAIILIAFFIGGLGGVFMGRVFIPYLASITGINSLNNLVTTSPIVVTRTQEVQLNEGVNLIDLVKQAGNGTVSIYDPTDNFLGNGVIMTSDGLIFTSNAVLGKQTAVTVMTNDGQKLPGVIKVKDAKNNLAVVSIAATGVAAAQFGSAANLETAQRLIYIGRGNVKFQHEAVAGFVTQSLANELTATKQISSDATLTSDYFGGPIIDLSGRVVGITLDGTQNMVAEDMQVVLSDYLKTSKPTQ